MLKAISVGRGEEVDVSIDDDTVSRLHVEIVLAGDNRFYITDCLSSGGTFVGRDGSWLPIKQEYVDAGEVLLLGHYQTTAAQLVNWANGADKTTGSSSQNIGSSGRKAIPQDQLPSGPVRRDPETGDIISMPKTVDK
jgi:predicted component of type VI protein secretion system